MLFLQACEIRSTFLPFCILLQERLVNQVRKSQESPKQRIKGHKFRTLKHANA